MNPKKFFRAFFLILNITAFVSCSCAKKGSPSDSYSLCVPVVTKGGSGRARVISPAILFEKDGKTFARIVWSSKNYDYIISGGKKYLNENPDGNSTFTFPVSSIKNARIAKNGGIEKPFSLKIKADTLAMGAPHEIDYELFFGEEKLSISPENFEFAKIGNFESKDSKPKSSKSKDSEKTESKKSSDSEIVLQADSEDSKNVFQPGFQTSFLSFEKCGSLNLSYAKEFSVDFYKCGNSGEIYCLVKIKNGGNFLLAPENAPEEIGNLKNLPENTFVLKKPLNKVYLVSTSAMDFVAKLGAVENLRFSGTKERGWFIPEAKDAMKSKKILYAGKYSAPDYELLLSRGCNLALENTMIFHNPEVKEKLEELGIPVVVERSVYEKNPLARLEWIKFYGILFERFEESEKYFEGEIEKISQAINLTKAEDKTGKNVAFFFVSSNGSVNVRSGGDYISKMIEMSGGKYVPSLGRQAFESARSTVNMQFESFYAAASNADILIYDRSIDKNLKTISQLKKKNPLFSDFKALKSGEVYCTKDDFFQKTTGTADFIADLEKIIGKGEDAKNLVFLEKMR